MRGNRRPVTWLGVSALALLAAIWSLPAAAEYEGPGGLRSGTVAEILKSSRDDQHVVIEGFLIKKVGKETYVFSDGTGEIEVEIDDDDLPVEPIDERTRVEISGKVDAHLLRKTEIDVDSVRVIRE